MIPRTSEELAGILADLLNRSTDEARTGEVFSSPSIWPPAARFEVETVQGAKWNVRVERVYD